MFNVYNNNINTGYEQTICNQPFCALIKSMKTQISEGKLTVFKLKILVRVKDLMVFFYPHRGIDLFENLK